MIKKDKFKKKMSKEKKLKNTTTKSTRIQTDNHKNGFNVLDLHNELSAERRAQVECVLRILQYFIKKLQICLVIPLLLTNTKESVEENWLHHKDDTDTDTDTECRKIEKYLAGNSLELKSTFQTNKLLDLLDYVDNHLEESNLWPKYSEFISKTDDSLVNSFNLLYDVAENRLLSSALSDLSKEKKLHKLNRNLSSIDQSIAEYVEKYRKQKVVQLWNLAYKGGLIQKYEEDLAFQKWDNNLRIKQEIVRSSKNIRCLQELSYGILKELEIETTKKRTAYNKLLRENLLFERDGHMEKKKLLFQLQVYIRKFDKNIGEKIQENLHLQEYYEEKKRNFDEFIIEFNRQEEEFNIIMRQKEMEDQLIFEQRLMVFMMGRAARVIQVYWRRFRRDQKKKSKRGKGKGKRK